MTLLDLVTDDLHGVSKPLPSLAAVREANRLKRLKSYSHYDTRLLREDDADGQSSTHGAAAQSPIHRPIRELKLASWRRLKTFQSAAAATATPTVRPLPEYMMQSEFRDEIGIPGGWSLPTRWAEHGKNKVAVVEANGLDISYLGTAKPVDRDVATIRANQWMPPACGIYYFEIELVSRGPSGRIAIGFQPQNAKTDRMLGADHDSFGYHGDTGMFHRHGAPPVNYNVKFVRGDIIGCGVDFASKSSFYTRSGVLIATIPHDLPVSKKTPLYPCVSLHSHGAKVKANFGTLNHLHGAKSPLGKYSSTSDFAFDIVTYVGNAREKFLSTLPVQPSVNPGSSLSRVNGEPAKPSITREDLPSLVSNYLLHSGYTKTAKVLFETTSPESASTREHVQNASLLRAAENRAKIRSLILSGNVSEASQMIRGKGKQMSSSNGHFNPLWEKGWEHIGFDLQLAELKELLSATGCASQVPEIGEEDNNDSTKTAIKQSSSMELDVNEPATSAIHQSNLELALQFARLIEPTNQEQQGALNELMALFAYSTAFKTTDKPIEVTGYIAKQAPSRLEALLDPALKFDLADKVNTALLTAQGSPAESDLFRLVKKLYDLRDRGAQAEVGGMCWLGIDGVGGWSANVGAYLRLLQELSSN